MTVAISTLGERARDIPLPWPGPWRRLVLAQAPDRATAAHLKALAETGADIVRLEGCGVARSRNAALAQAGSDLVLFADDDVMLCPDALQRIVDVFVARPELDLLCTRLSDYCGAPHKRYSPHATPLRPWNAGKVGTPEIALRLGPVRKAGLTFDERFGAGTPLGFGEEFIFLADALRAGLRGEHVDIVTGQHHAQSSGLARGPQSDAIRKEVFRRALGKWGWWAFHAHRLRDGLFYRRAGNSS
jgi:hypothetical protein